MTDGSGRRHFWRIGRLVRGLAAHRGRRLPAALTFALGLVLLQATPAGAVAVLGAAPAPAVRSSTQIVMSNPISGSGQALNGYSATEPSSFDPVRDGYPASNPPTNTGLWRTHNLSFAGTLRAHPVDSPSTQLLLYCIDIHTVTRAGLGYNLGSWEASGMPNVGYVARLLTDYYPNTNQPSSLGSDNQRAAAVQAAIWFFTDRFVVTTSGQGSNLRAAIVTIVNTVRAQGPLLTPPPPSLTITPTALSGHVTVLGPFRVATNHTPVTITVTGGTMYSNAGATTVLGNGTTATLTHSPQDVWLRRSPANPTDIVILHATSTATVPSGNVYLYDGSTAGTTDAQRVILAAPATLTTTVSATGEFRPFGSLIVRKTIDGPAADHRGDVRIRVKCDDGVSRPDFVISAGAPAGTHEHTYSPIAAGTECIVTETLNGSTSTVAVQVRGDGQEVTVPAGGTKTVEITDTYRHVPGALIVRKTIAGPAAGRQGEVRIRVRCDGTYLTPDFVIPARTSTPEQTKQYDNIPTPATCTVTETVNGSSSTVSVDVEGSGQKVAVGPGEVKVADISDTYGLVPGELEVSKVIAGPLAGHQGEVIIHTVCNGTPLTPDLIIPALTSGPVESHIYSGIATPATCVVTETVDGATSTVSVEVTGSPNTVKIRPGGSGAATITDEYGAVPGSLLVTKTITGPSAGHQGPITIAVVCDGVALSPELVIPAHTPAGSVSHSFNDIPAGSTCTVTETSDGGSNTVIVISAGNGQTVTIPAATVVPVSVMDVYDDGSNVGEVPEEPGSPAVDATGSLTVIKHITGPAARHHGGIAILVSCGGTLESFSLDIPAGAGRGSVTHHFNNIPSGLRCTVGETATGATGRVRAVTRAADQTVTIPTSGTVVVQITDTFSTGVPAPTFTG